MFKRTAIVAIIVITLAVFISLAAWAAFDCFSVKGLERMSSNPQIVNSGVLGKIKPLSLNFGNQLGALLLGNSRSWTWGELVNSAMNKGAEIYNVKAFEMFLGKGSELACQEFLNSWSFGGLQLSQDTKNKINNLTRSHFLELGNILRGVSGSRMIIGDSGFPKGEKYEYKEGGEELKIELPVEKHK